MSASFRLLCPESPVEYGEGLALLRGLHAGVAEGREPETLVLLEHAPVITLGRNADPACVLAPPHLLATLGVPVVRVERGGQATMHLPGQLVAYPVFSLRGRNLGVKRYVNLLEEAMLGTAGKLGCEACRREGLTGIFTGSGKLGAVGVAVKSGVSLHGLALNVCCDLSRFELIVPCGLKEVRQVSISGEVGRSVPVAEARAAMAGIIAELF